METWVIALVIALVNVGGGGLVIKWLVRQINALKGTVSAQTQTLSTIGEVNRTLLQYMIVSSTPSRRECLRRPPASSVQAARGAARSSSPRPATP